MRLCTFHECSVGEHDKCKREYPAPPGVYGGSRCNCSCHIPSVDNEIDLAIRHMRAESLNICEVNQLRSTITALESKLAKYEKALRPFADFLPKIDPDWQNGHIVLGGRFSDGPIIVAENFRLAATTLEETK
jgi:hypothetical protein